MGRPEILAPAGSMEALIAAVRCGADAVYVGGTSYSARSSATNFDAQQLAQAAEICRLYGVKLHLAVNTLLTDTELPAFQRYLQTIGQYPDACIVQDLGAVRVIREILPDMPVHASTQMSIHSPAGAEMAMQLGCSRVVAAREMSKDDLAALCRMPVEVEAFVHGALCMSVSGQCSFSAIVGGRSANRGACAQACRLPWHTPKGKNPAALSLKDLSLVERVQELCEIGIDSFKIEGRMKRPEYVAAAVTALRMALDGEQPDMETLQAVFSRSGFTDGYFTGRKQNMFGFRRKEDVLAAGGVFDQLARLYAKPRTVERLDFSMCLTPEMPSCLTVHDSQGHSAAVYGDVPEVPQKSPLTQEVLQKSMQKLGGTIYTCGEVLLDNPQGLFLSSAQCNALRREAAESMDKLRIGLQLPPYVQRRVEQTMVELPSDRVEQPQGTYRIHVRTNGQLTAALGTGCIVCVPLQMAEQCDASPSIWLEAPRIIADETAYRTMLSVLRDRGFTELVCHNLADVQIGAELGMHLHGGFGLNVTNRLSALTLREQGLEDVCASIELRMQRIAELGQVLPVGAMVYGRLPMMLYRVCPIRSQEGCRKRDCFLTDRTGRQFPLLCSGHYQEMVNADILYLAGKPMPLDYFDLYFTDEVPSQVEAVLNAYRDGRGEAPKARTSGLYYKGGLQ